MNTYYITAAELAERGLENIPDELVSSKNLIYSSPATLAFNSPGALGFGVKRAGLAIPGSVMLLVAPACCGRNTQLLNSLGYADRFFYMLQDETDIVTGRHLNRIKKAVKEIVDSAEEKPTAVMICITCVDALLGTDMERVCRQSTEYAGVPVLPCYMYALTREGRVPPMTSVRKTVYQLLEPDKRQADVVNIMGEFAPLDDSCEIYEILKKHGIRQINEISRCTTFEEYKAMSKANFNLVLNPESRLAAEDLKKRLNIPSIELTRCYQLDKIQKQYELFGSSIGITISDKKYREESEALLQQFGEAHPNTSLAIGEWVNGDPFEMALAWIRYGHQVKEIYGTISGTNFIYIKKIAELSPDTRIYSNLTPTMINYAVGETSVDVTIGMDAAFYHPDAPNVPFNEENKPFGYAGLNLMIRKVAEAMEGR